MSRYHNPALDPEYADTEAEDRAAHRRGDYDSDADLDALASRADDREQRWADGR